MYFHLTKNRGQAYHFKLRLIAILPMVFLGLSSFSAAQQSPESPAIKLSVLVMDKSNHRRENLKKEDFELLEDKVPQTLTSLDVDQRRVSYGLVIYESGSFKNLLEPARAAAETVIRNNRPGDETFIEGFIGSDNIETLREFTTDQNDLLEGLRKIKVRMGQSAVVDALYVAVDHIADYKPGTDRRRALILISDGEDRASYYSQDELFTSLRAKGVQCFAIGMLMQLEDDAGLIRRSSRAKAEELLTRLAQETGGRGFFPRTRAELAEAVKQIVLDLHGQYVLAYTPVNAEKQGFRKVQIRLTGAAANEKLTVISRAGYYLHPPPSQTPKQKSR